MPTRTASGPCPHAVLAAEDDSAAESVLRFVDCDAPVGTFYRCDDSVLRQIL
ncbi:MAG TPA: hypothetical protein VF892_20340 [Pseudonocardiaceae bacterium]